MPGRIGRRDIGGGALAGRFDRRPGQRGGMMQRRSYPLSCEELVIVKITSTR
jgi:hypothetical protein